MARSKLLADYNVDPNRLLGDFLQLLEEEFAGIFIQDSVQYHRVSRLFVCCLGDMNHLFPNLNVPVTSVDPKDYMRKWLRRYHQADQMPPSIHIASPKRSSDDPALSVIIRAKLDLTESGVEQNLLAHNLFMSAENVQGALLEEYIASIAEPQGWIWAKGETMRACDFVRPASQNFLITEYVQIKNRDNTENSSSNAIRSGTQINKWVRLKTRRQGGLPVAESQWPHLNQMMHLQGRVTSEEDYEEFLRGVVSKNPGIIL